MIRLRTSLATKYINEDENEILVGALLEKVSLSLSLHLFSSLSLSTIVSTSWGPTMSRKCCCLTTWKKSQCQVCLLPCSSPGAPGAKKLLPWNTKSLPWCKKLLPWSDKSYWNLAHQKYFAYSKNDSATERRQIHYT